MKNRFHDKDRDFHRERRISPKEKLLLDTLHYWGFHQAASNIECQRERVDLDAAIASWANYPKCMDDYPTVITKKVKIDPKELVI